ncbi:MAG: histidine kinase [Prevotella sp.]|nr:histidine kinase [Prevotella sp.]
MPFEWSDVFHLWRQYAMFLAVFLVHNFLLAPLLIERQRRWLYFSLVALLLAGFAVVQCSSRPDEKPVPEREEMAGHQPPMMDDVPPPEWDDAWDDAWDDEERAASPHPEPHPAMGPRPHKGEHPPFFMGQQDVVAVIVLILMLGMNVGVKLYFRQRRDRRKLAEMEKKSLEQQLEYLKYQINPHFLMNTLNNIHALVDIDAERAKESIVELSKIMRFVLYEGSKQTVPLGRELAFTQDYIELMRIRVTDRVKISVKMPEHAPDSQIPPLMLITFVENAFKHGISYRQESFIDIEVQVADGRLRFTCSNSKVPQAEDKHGGVGLQNVKRRLELIYGENYTLNIDDQSETYNIELVIPL